MASHARDLTVSEFKAHCLEVIDRVASTGEAVVLTRRGRAVVRLVAVTDAPGPSPQSRLAGTVETEDDLIAPAFDPGAFTALRPLPRRPRAKR